jgi:hypothetical protein
MLDEATNAVTHAREPLLVVIVAAPIQDARQAGAEVRSPCFEGDPRRTTLRAPDRFRDE